ncbi:hypothetical protein [Dyadobacter sp. CY343]|uniref:hypothetical protein n=1 Tax=Dyadobacter sp. CY343 TaxID=2907299 RepID=UPI001F17CDA8|nr:hypothetical protein [Dyadobacter sp. CY343]MCE7062217.1 hypothetical protein [Dyadobacter sp. CY343]
MSVIVGSAVLSTMSSCRKPVDVIEAEKGQESVDSIPSTGHNPVQLEDPIFLNRHFAKGFITDQITKTPEDSPLLPWLAREAAAFDPGNLVLTGNTSPMLAFGDGMSAGWMNGGLYRAGQQTAFPNLIAHQMGLKNFKSPLFDLEHGNGTGYFVQTSKNGSPTWSEVTNNLAITKLSNVPEMVPYQGGDVENMSEPRLDQGGIGGTLSPKENGWVYGADGRGWTDDMIFFWRMKPNADKSKDTYWDLLNTSVSTKKPAIVISSFGFDTWAELNIKEATRGIDWAMSSSESSALTISVAEVAQRAGSQGIVYTIPAFRHLPYFSWQTQLSGPATPEQYSAATLSGTNQRIREEAKTKKLLVVDLEKIYEQIFAGTYVTGDGYKISGKPGGNFFSGDGIYPSAIGNAVIANETIKVINAHFGSKIPLINLNEYAAYIK